VPLDDLVSIQRAVLDAMAALKDIDARMREADAPPAFDPLLGLLARIERLVALHIAAHPGRAETPEAAPAMAAATPVGGIGAIRSRQDAVRTMQAVAEFFRQNEPSSPVPMLLDRAARLVSKSFLDVLADVAPDGVAQARAVGGIRDDE
jgi:type VI secretion system protein ImpA